MPKKTDTFLSALTPGKSEKKITSEKKKRFAQGVKASKTKNSTGGNRYLKMPKKLKVPLKKRDGER